MVLLVSEASSETVVLSMVGGTWIFGFLLLSYKHSDRITAAQPRIIAAQVVNPSMANVPQRAFLLFLHHRHH